MVSEIIVNQLLQSFASAPLTLFFQVITFFGHPLPWLFIAAWLFWLHKEKKSFMLVSLILFAGFVSGALKLIIARPRPEGLLVFEKPMTEFSLPSGHSTLAGTVFGFFETKVFPKEKLLLLTLALLTALSRLYLGVHFLSDVLAGLLIGYLIGKGALLVEKKVAKSHLHISKIREEGLLVLLFIIIIGTTLLLPEELYSAQALFGYFFGFAFYRHTSLGEKRTHNKKLSLTAGTIILAIIGFFAFSFTGLKSQSLFFLAGFFISFIWPLVVAKAKM